MNFLAHYLLAMGFRPPASSVPAYVVGTALPDLVPLAADRVRLRPSQLAVLASAESEFGAALRAGILTHLATDAAFHKTQAFVETQAEVSGILARMPFDGIRVRRFFLAHVLTELALDAVLLRKDPAIADRFYSAFTEAEPAAVTRWTENITGGPIPALADVLTRFDRSQYLRQYSTDEGVATGLDRLCKRARQDTFEGDNFTRLVTVVHETITLLPKYLPSLLSETAADIPNHSLIPQSFFAKKQEFTQTTLKAAPIMTAQTPTEKKYRIHFPLKQISTPVMTHLVTDYDLSPNLLRADIDAKNGGWLVLGLTGDDARLHSALDWLRGQGLDVEEEG